jgi:hypothetical protein
VLFDSGGYRLRVSDHKARPPRGSAVKGSPPSLQLDLQGPVGGTSSDTRTTSVPLLLGSSAEGYRVPGASAAPAALPSNRRPIRANKAVLDSARGTAQGGLGCAARLVDLL